MSPVFEERKTHNYFSEIVKHHVGRNKHHWEYWCDTFIGNMVIKTMVIQKKISLSLKKKKDKTLRLNFNY